jgi:hypothetical protein
MMTEFRFKELVLNQTEEAILISWRLQQWYEGMVLDPRAMQNLQDAIEMLKTLAKQVNK